MDLLGTPGPGWGAFVQCRVGSVPPLAGEDVSDPLNAVGRSARLRVRRADPPALLLVPWGLGIYNPVTWIRPWHPRHRQHLGLKALAGDPIGMAPRTQRAGMLRAEGDASCRGFFSGGGCQTVAPQAERPQSIVP